MVGMRERENVLCTFEVEFGIYVMPHYRRFFHNNYHFISLLLILDMVRKLLEGRNQILFVFISFQVLGECFWFEKECQFSI